MKPSMAKIVAPGRRGVAEVSHFEISEQEAAFANLRASIGHSLEAVRPGVYAKLTVGSVLMMTDTDMEWNTFRELRRHSKGDVLVGGMGLGFVLSYLLNKPEVRSVVVVEKESDVIALVAPYLRGLSGAEKMYVICDDIFTFSPAARGRIYDTVWLDIWPTICSDNISAMRTLRARYRTRIRKGGWIGCWSENEVSR